MSSLCVTLSRAVRRARATWNSTDSSRSSTCTRSSALWKPAVRTSGGVWTERAEAVRRGRARRAQVDRVREAGAQHRQQRDVVARGDQHARRSRPSARTSGTRRCPRPAPRATPARRAGRRRAGPAPSRSTSASVVPGRIRQSSSTEARAGITFRLVEPSSRVGAIVVPASAGSECAEHRVQRRRPGGRATSVTAPSSTSSVASTSGDDPGRASRGRPGAAARPAAGRRCRRRRASTRARPRRPPTTRAG